MKVKIIGAGLAGCEAAYYLATHGISVTLYDIKPHSFTPAHTNPDFGELVCSNSLKSNDVYGNACGLLKEEMRILGSMIIDCADKTRVPAGNALAVERDDFAALITKKIRSCENIEIVCEEVSSIPDDSDYVIVATGPLTCGKLAEDIENNLGGLHFFDAAAPIVTGESVDREKSFVGDRYGKGDGDYINCPMNKEEYEKFVSELISAEKVIAHGFEKRSFFDGCMPVEVMASRGIDTLRFGPFKPVGLEDESGKRYYACLQLRKEDSLGSAYNLVGCQTNLKFGEQKRVFSLIPALKNAEYLRYGVMHRNTYINAPDHLNPDFSMKARNNVYFAGQITGVEGYVESAASGLLCAISIYLKTKNGELTLDDTTILGGLSRHISTPCKNFQPMNANFGMLRDLPQRIRDKAKTKEIQATIALESVRELKNYIQEKGE